MDHDLPSCPAVKITLTLHSFICQDCVRNLFSIPVGNMMWIYCLFMLSSSSSSKTAGIASPSSSPPICVQKSRSRVRTRSCHVWSGRGWCEGPVGGANLSGATLKKQSRRPVNQRPSQTEAVWGPLPLPPSSTAAGREAPADWPRSGEPDETRAPIG